MKKNILNSVRILRDIGMVIGVPTIIMTGVYFYNQKIELIKEQLNSCRQQVNISTEHIELLKVTQYDKVEELVESQKKLYEKELHHIKIELSNARNYAYNKDRQVIELKNKLREVKYEIIKINAIKKIISMNTPMGELVLNLCESTDYSDNQNETNWIFTYEGDF